MTDKKETVLVTGNAGLLGTHFVKHLKGQNKYAVIGIDNFFGGYASNVDYSGPDHFYQTDLLDRKAVQEIFQNHKPDYVYHLAAYAAEGLSPFIRKFNYEQNLCTWGNVLSNCVDHNVEKVIVASSMSVYGSQNPPFNEDMVGKPEDPYALAKWAMELDAKMAYEHFGQNFSIVRPHNIIGPYQNIWDRYRNVIGIWIRRVIDKKTITVYGDGSQVRAFSDVKFYMEPFEKLMKKADRETINIGADKEMTILDAAKCVQRISNEFGYEPGMEFFEPRKEVKFAYCDHEKAKNLLDFEDSTNFEETVREMFTWALQQPSRTVRQMDYEITKGLYSFWK